MTEPINLAALRAGCAPLTPETVAALINAAHAAQDILDVAERIRGGDASLDPEEWYARRDFARMVLARFDFSQPDVDR